MSKAFTRESDTEEIIAPQRAPLPPGTRNYITRAGAERVQAELDSMLERKRDLAEKVGAEQQVQALEARIQQLQLLIATFVVAEPPAGDTVRFGARVTIRRAGGEETYTIVGVDEIDLERNLISWLSPLARAVTGRRVGERVRFQSPVGLEELEIVRIG